MFLANIIDINDSKDLLILRGIMDSRGHWSLVWETMAISHVGLLHGYIVLKHKLISNRENVNSVPLCASLIWLVTIPTVDRVNFLSTTLYYVWDSALLTNIILFGKVVDEFTFVQFQQWQIQDFRREGLALRNNNASNYYVWGADLQSRKNINIDPCEICLLAFQMRGLRQHAL